MKAYPDTSEPARYEPCAAHTDAFDAECVACLWSTVLGLVHHINTLHGAVRRLRMFGG